MFQKLEPIYLTDVSTSSIPGFCTLVCETMCALRLFSKRKLILLQRLLSAVVWHFGRSVIYNENPKK